MIHGSPERDKTFIFLSGESAGRANGGSRVRNEDDERAGRFVTPPVNTGAPGRSLRAREAYESRRR
jgi:hypothetical protein